jgi:elongator complex protein 1
LSSILTKADDKVSTPEWDRRRVERGSRIIIAVPSTMNLVLQMPRGNLETISPRPLIMEVVKKDLDV